MQCCISCYAERHYSKCCGIYFPLYFIPIFYISHTFLSYSILFHFSYFLDFSLSLFPFSISFFKHFLRLFLLSWYLISTIFSSPYSNLSLSYSNFSNSFPTPFSIHYSSIFSLPDFNISHLLILFFHFLFQCLPFSHSYIFSFSFHIATSSSKS